LGFAVPILLLSLGLPTLASAQYSTPTIVIDYTYDTNTFFTAGSAQRTALETAASRLSSRLGDTLTAIAPSGINTWNATFTNPANGNSASISNLQVAQNAIIVYAGGRDLTGGTLGIGGPGGFSGSGTTAFLNTVRVRGQTGGLGTASSQTDFGPWGGSITFDSIGTNWNFALTAPSAGQADFLSVAEHELGHLLGLGTANSWSNKIIGTTFTGANATAYNGGINPSVTADGGHWASGTISNIDGVAQEAAMTPSIFIGSRKEFTAIDYAGLADVGWQVSPIPEPTTVLGFACSAFAVGCGLRRRRFAKAI